VASARRLVLGFCTWALLTTLWLSGAWAHAALTGTLPAGGAHLPAVPSLAVLRFNEPVSALVLRLILPGGANLELPTPSAAGADLSIPLPPSTHPGTYVLSWRVVSEDGHPVAGTLIFTVGDGDASAVISPTDHDYVVTAAGLVSRWALYLGLAFGVGGAITAASLRTIPAAVGTIATWATAVGFAGLLCGWGLYGLDALGLPLYGLVREDVWAIPFATTLSSSAGLFALALFVAWLSLFLGPHLGLALVGLLLAGLGLAATGHAATADPQWLMRSAVALHGIAMMTWLGALPALIVTLSANKPSPAALRAFSVAIPYGLAALIVTGTVLAVVQLQSPVTLVTTPYGWVLGAKLAVVAAILVIAAFNRWRWTAPALSGDRASARALRRAIAVEIILLAGVLAIVTLWRTTPPPRAFAPIATVADEARPSSLTLSGNGLTARVDIGNARAGTTEAVISFVPALPTAPQQVTLFAANPAAGIEALSPQTMQMGPLWHVPELVLPAAGAWTVTVQVRVSDFQLVTLQGQFDVLP